MTLREYLYVELFLIPSTILILPTKWSTCYSSLKIMIVSLGIPYTPSISDVVVMYASVSMISLVGITILNNCCKANHFSNSFPRKFSRYYDAPLVLHIIIFQ